MAARPQHSLAYKKMCATLREMRAAAGLTQRDLAVRLRMHHTMVHRSEIGDRRIDPVEFVNWCKACGFDAGEVIRKL